MRRILFVSPFIWEGGLHKGKPTVYYIMRGFLRAGYDVHVVTATNKPGLTHAEIDGLTVHYFHLPINPFGFKYDALESFLHLVRSEPNRLIRHLKFRLFWLQFVLFGVFKAWSVASRWPPDLVYGINNPSIPISFLISRLFHVPTLSRIMGSSILGQWAQVNLSKKYLMKGLDLLRLWLTRFDELLAFKLPCEAVIVTDDGTIAAEAITKWLGVPSERLWLLRNGIDKTAFQQGPDRHTARQILQIDPDIKVVLWVSQLVDWKHPERLINAVPQVIEHCPNTRFLIVGDGPERTALEQLATQLGVDHFVHFAGFVERDKLPLYFRAADVFTAFYDYANISNSLLEAMLSGNAVVTLNNGHTSNVVKHLENGFLVDPDCLTDIPDAIVRILKDDNLRQRLSHGAATYADQTLLTWDERIAHEIAEIEKILARRRDVNQ